MINKMIKTAGIKRELKRMGTGANKNAIELIKKELTKDMQEIVHLAWLKAKYAGRKKIRAEDIRSALNELEK